MATASALPLVPIDEYLATAYEPDMEYVDGVLVERDVGKRKHSRIQGLIYGHLLPKEAQYQFVAYPEQRIRVGPSRFRIPDVCVMPASHKREEVFTEPPLLVFEVVSPGDAFSDVVLKAGEYRAAGVRHICIVDPYSQTVFRVDEHGRVTQSAAAEVSFHLVEALPPLSFDFAGWFSEL